MDVLVPFDAGEPKTRLGGLLDPDERAAFARASLLDVCDAVGGAGGNPTVLATGPNDVPYPVTVDDRPLSVAVNAHLDPPMGVVVADLPLATASALERLFEVDADVVIAPGRRGGTNALVVRHPDVAVDYHGASVRDHRRIADDLGASVAEVDSFRLAVDADEPADLVEVLLHAEGRAGEWLREAGFGIEIGDGGVRVCRE